MENGYLKVTCVDPSCSTPYLQHGRTYWVYDVEEDDNETFFSIVREPGDEPYGTFRATRFSIDAPDLTMEEACAIMESKEKKDMSVSNYRVRTTPVVQRFSESGRRWVTVDLDEMPAEYIINCLRKDLNGLTASQAVNSDLIKAYITALAEYFENEG